MLSAVFIFEGARRSKEFSQALNKIMDISEDEQISLKDWIKDVLSNFLVPDKRKELDAIIDNLGKERVDMTYAFEEVLLSEREESKLVGREEGKLEGKIESAVNMIIELKYRE